MGNASLKRALRRGGSAIELLFALPVLLVVLFGTVEFAMVLIARQQLLAASREGARVAAQGGTADEVEDAVRTFLGQGSLSQATVASVLADDFGNPLPSGE